MRADFLEIASYARSSGFIPGLMTNCTMLSANLVQDIAELKPFSITTSLYGASATTHDAITQIAGSYEKTLNGIKLLVEHGLVPLVQTVVMKANLNELEDIRRLVASLGAKSRTDMGIAPSKTGADFPLKFEPDEADLTGCVLYPDIINDMRNSGQGMCKAGKALCSISPSGNVSPCSIFPLKLGNLRKSSFDTIWHLEPCTELRYLRSMRRNDLYACNQCHLSAYCQRCTGIAYIESGHPNGPSSSACRQAQMRWRLNPAAEVSPCQKNLI